MYAVFDQTGNPVGFYSADIHAQLPDGAVEISETQWREFIDNPGRRRWDDVTDSVVTYSPPIDGAALKRAARTRVDAAAEQARLHYITPGACQALVYQRKEMQARDCLASHDIVNPPPAGKYPAIEAEIGITGVDTLAVAQTVVTLADQWGAIADAIEAQRLSAKAAIEAVPDNAADIEAQIAAIEAGIVWPAP